MHSLETDLGHFQQKWRMLWDKLECPNREHIHRNLSFNTQIVKSHGRSIHKRSTLEILVKGKMLGEAAKMFSQPHRFEKYTYTTPAYCDYCSQVLWGLLKTGAALWFTSWYRVYFFINVPCSVVFFVCRSQRYFFCNTLANNICSWLYLYLKYRRSCLMLISSNLIRQIARWQFWMSHGMCQWSYNIEICCRNGTFGIKK